jgi:L-threonylcarbamoyladenylate synthase
MGTHRMDTRITRSPRVAAALLGRGGVVAFPTETVYGLGAAAFDTAAVAAIFRAKGRPPDNPLIVHLAAVEELDRVARRIPVAAARLLAAFAPGPLTVIVPRRRELPDAVTAGLDTVGVRVPAHPVARAFLEAAAVPVAAPSANRSGRPSPTTWTAVQDELAGRITGILQGGASEVGLESTVVDCTAGRPMILREGAVTLEMLRRVEPGVRGRPAAGEHAGPARSPGQKYRHYAPAARVVLVDGPAAVPEAGVQKAGYIGLEVCGFSRRPAWVVGCATVEEYARRLFDSFRAAEARGLMVVYCQRVPRTGLGRAVMDRLHRAAEG